MDKKEEYKSPVVEFDIFESENTIRTSKYDDPITIGLPFA